MRRLGWRWIWIGLLLLVVCAACDDKPIANGKPDDDKEKTAEVMLVRESGTTPPPTAFTVEVHCGDIDVIAVDVAAALKTAVIIDDDIAFADNVTETFEIKDGARALRTTHALGINGPAATTHVRVPENLPLNLRTFKGNIHVAGRVGAVTAQTDAGSIEVRGPTGPLSLTASSGIVVDGSSGELNLTTTKGDIRILSEVAWVHATVKQEGNILFVGSLNSGISSFVAANTGNITIVMPPQTAYTFNARTSDGKIVAQYSTSSAKPIPICGTMDPGSPVDTHTSYTADTHGQITVNEGVTPFTGTAIISGVVTSDYLMFHTNVSTIRARLPDLSDLALDLLQAPATIPDPFSNMITPTPSAPVPTAVASADSSTNADVDAQLRSFMSSGGAAAPATPLDANSGNVSSAVNPAMSVGGRPGPVAMKGHNCTLELPGSQAINITATSTKGFIRILQATFKISP